MASSKIVFVISSVSRNQISMKNSISTGEI